MMDREEERRGSGLSIGKVTFGGIIAVIGLLASGVATYNGIQTDIASFKRGEQYQERVNDQLREEIRSARTEQRENLQGVNNKLDRLIEHWQARK